MITLSNFIILIAYFVGINYWFFMFYRKMLLKIVRFYTFMLGYIELILLLSGKTQNRIKSLSEHLYNQGFGLFHDKSRPPLTKKYWFWGCFLNISCNNIIPCFVRILHKRDKVDVVHECEANHCDHL